MRPFIKNQDARVKRFILKLVNNNCLGMQASLDDQRQDNRVNLTMVVMVIPIENERLHIAEGFTAVTKEFSNAGVAVVLDRTETLNEALLGFRFEGEMTFIRAEAKHLNPMGGGFYQLGFQLMEVVPVADYPGLEVLSV
jgi:hypothetical protein